MRRIGSTLMMLGAVVALALALASPAAGKSERAGLYRVTVTDLTGGQPLTPPVVTTHRGKNLLFRVGAPASTEIKEIAENGNNAPLLGALGGDGRVADFGEAPGGPLVPPGRPGSAMFDETTSIELDASHGASRVSLASMLICTNDGFTGVNGLKLPKLVGQSVTVQTAGYDAGTEVNTEDFADIVPPCQSLIGVSSGEPGTGTSNPALAQGGVIAHHPGIQGGSDLVPAIHGWTDPVAEIEVEAIG
jgi:Spondin_N